MATVWILLISTLVVAVTFVSSAAYKDGEKVTVYVNKVGPYFNPHETYHYYQLPVCRPQKIEHKSLTQGEVLDGDRMAVSLYDITYKTDVATRKELCRITYTENDLEPLRNAAEKLYYFEFVIDDIPICGFIGHLEEGGFLPQNHKLYLWTHLHFNIEFNGEHVIYANVTTKEQLPISAGVTSTPLEVAFTYSVKWIPTELSYKQRASRIRDYLFVPKNVEMDIRKCEMHSKG